MFLCICFIIILVSSPTFEREKRKSFEFWGPRGEWAKPRGKIQARSPCPSVGCLPGKHLHKLLAFKTRQPMPMYFRLDGQAGIETLFVFCFFFTFSRLSSEPPHITCLALMMLLIKCSLSVGGFAWQAWCLSFSKISPLLALSTSHSPTQQRRALDTQPVNSSLANYHLWLPYKAGLCSHHCSCNWLPYLDSVSLHFFVFFFINPSYILNHFTYFFWLVLASFTYLICHRQQTFMRNNNKYWIWMQYFQTITGMGICSSFIVGG